MDKLLKQALMNPTDSYSPEFVKSMLDQNAEAIQRFGYFAAAILILVTVLAIYVIISNRLMAGRLKKLKNLEKTTAKLKLNQETIMESVSIQKNLSQIYDEKFPSIDQIKKNYGKVTE